MLPSDVLSVLHTLEIAGYATWAVGGCVRDWLRGVPAQDFDLATTCPAERVLAFFPQCRPTGLAYGTVTVLTDRRPVEVTTLRTETASADRRHPAAVAPAATIAEDLSRRDFTVNAMAWHPTRGLCDPYGGQDDMRARRIRAVGEPAQRFKEDALRVLRCYRFASVLAYTIETSTRQAARQAAWTLSALPAERVMHELLRLLDGQTPSRIAELVQAGGLDKYGLKTLKTPDRLDALPPETAWRLAGLLFLADILPDQLQNWRLDRHLKEDTVCYLSLLRQPLPTSSLALKRAYTRLSPRRWPAYLAARKALLGEDGSRVQAWLDSTAEQPYCRAMLALSGEQLTALGVAGPAVGALLDHLLELVLIHPEYNTPEVLLAEVYKLL